MSPHTVSAQNRDNPAVSRAKVAAVNVAIGGITAGVLQVRHGGSFWKGMLKGAGGGALVFAGKCTIAQKKTAGNWIGRGTVFLGSSMIANASDNRPVLQHLFGSFGPLYFERDNNQHKQRIKLNLTASLVTAYFATRPNSSFQGRTSMNHAAFVFQNPSRKRESPVQAAPSCWAIPH